MTKGQEWMDEFYESCHLFILPNPSLPDFLDRKIEELRDEYQKEVLEAWAAGYEYYKHLDKIFGGSK
jgi:hypothetical protein